MPYESAEILREEINRKIRKTERCLEEIASTGKQVNNMEEEFLDGFWESRREMELIFECASGYQVNCYADEEVSHNKEAAHRMSHLADETREELKAEERRLEYKYEEYQDELMAIRRREENENAW
jgi:hypothetical protein